MIYFLSNVFFFLHDMFLRVIISFYGDIDRMKQSERKHNQSQFCHFILVNGLYLGYDVNNTEKYCKSSRNTFGRGLNKSPKRKQQYLLFRNLLKLIGIFLQAFDKTEITQSTYSIWKFHSTEADKYQISMYTTHLK